MCSISPLNSRTPIGMRSDKSGDVEALSGIRLAESAGFKIGQVLLEADGIPIAEVAKMEVDDSDAKLDKQRDIKFASPKGWLGETTLSLPL